MINLIFIYYINPNFKTTHEDLRTLSIDQPNS